MAAVLLIAAETPETHRALSGNWVGTLEYRDFSEPAGSSKRVKIPSWLTIEIAGDDLTFRYIYDDGPAKTVSETSTVRIDPATRRYTILNRDGKVEDTYEVSGLAELREGRGALVLTGVGKENGVAVNVRTSMRIGRNILEILRETAPPGQPFVFRHSYTMVRSVPPRN
jgi:hypothetical protein